MRVLTGHIWILERSRENKMEVRVKVEGLEEAINAAKGFPGAANREIDLIMGRAANMGMTWMYPDTPVGNTMMLRNSLFSRQNSPSSMEIGATAPYAVFVHEGTRPHEILPVRAQALKSTGADGSFSLATNARQNGTTNTLNVNDVQGRGGSTVAGISGNLNHAEVPISSSNLFDLFYFNNNADGILIDISLLGFTVAGI